ncbi:ABC transporter permease [Shewanella cyperi]|uniref:ABC transporter permease n=1 Tax=Shewanella cyperi TaxID=2814292 RepID=UPI001A9404BC|nr:FtsX-like permease family protein [Shewanella cyperi]QSX39528.1 ABC transporter permease [Shewanella cyperi]
MGLTLALRLLRRELRQGQLLLIVLAIALAVLAVTGLARVSERLQLAINGQASRFIAADRIIESPQPIAETILALADKLQLRRVDSLQFNSMVYAGEAFQLVTVRAVADGYPLKGHIAMIDGPADGLPAVGSLWYESRLGGLLGYPQHIELGERNFNMAGEIAQLPDAGFNPFASAPVVLMRLEDVASTGVISPGSRVTYRYQFAGDPAALADFEAKVKAELSSSQRWIDPTSGDSPVAQAVVRAERFLLLASLLGIALACAAIGIAAQRYCQRHYDVVAMLKTFGASAVQIRTIFGLHLLLVTLTGVCLGLLGGLALDAAVSAFLPPSIRVYDAPLLRPLLLGCTTGLISALMFSAYPMLRLLRIPPLRVLNGQLEGLTPGMWLHLLLSLSAMTALGWIYSRSWALTLSVVAGVLLLALLLVVLGLTMIRLGHGLGMRTTNPMQLALAGLRRRARQNALQLVGFSTALVLLLTILALRQDLLQEWRQQLPEGAPNYFLVNIAPEDEVPLKAFFDERGIEATAIYPVVRGRLAAINGEPLVSQEQAEAEGGRVGIGRELNLTWQERIPANNELLSGKFTPDADTVSVESGVAERLGIGLGDKLEFVIDNRPVSVRVTSVRQVHWETLQPNFFMIFPPAALQGFAYTSMASFHLPAERRELILSLIKGFPTISVIDVDAMVGQLRDIVAQVSMALSLVLALVLCASALVLFAQTEAGMVLRQRELAVLRTFGAPGRLLRLATAMEFALLGGIAGLLAVLVSEFSLYLLKTQVFELKAFLHPQWWPLACGGGAILVASLGYWRCRQLLQRTAASLLRAD